jgi:hypothetical protein
MMRKGDGLITDYLSMDKRRLSNGLYVPKAFTMLPHGLLSDLVMRVQQSDPTKTENACIVDVGGISLGISAFAYMDNQLTRLGSHKIN